MFNFLLNNKPKPKPKPIENKKIFKSLKEIEQEFNFIFENVDTFEEKIINIFNDNINIDETDISSLRAVGIYYQYKIKDYNIMENFHLKAIHLGNVTSMLDMAIYYENIENYNKMKKYYLIAIESNSLLAMFNLAYHYQYIEKDYDKMKEYYLMAINLKLISAINNLGNYYQYIEKNYVEMEKYYLMGIELNSRNCMCNFGTYYRDIRDYDNAIKYYMMAINYGSIDAYNYIQNYEKNKLYDIFFDFYMENNVSDFFIEKFKEVKKYTKNIIPIRPINKIYKYIYETYIIENKKSEYAYKNDFIIYAKKDNEIKEYYVNDFVLNSRFFRTLLDGPFEKKNSTNIDVMDFKIIDILIKYLYINKLDYEDINKEEITELLRIADYWEFIELVKIFKILNDF